MNDRGPNWDHFSGDFEYWQQCGARPPGPFGWNAPDPSWFSKPPWPGNPPFQHGPQMPETQSYPFPPPDTADPYHTRSYGGPDFRYPGDQSNFRPHNPPSYGFHPQRSSKSTDNCGSGSDEFTQADIEQSEKNLQAQYDSLQTRQEMEIRELLAKKREQHVREVGESLNVSWDQMNEVIQPLIEACTKENISKGKTWVVEKMAESPELTNLMSDYLVARASALNVTFDLRLHLVYLLNDLLHHCKRRGAPTHLQEVLQKVVPIIFCLATELADEERKAKINRVLDLWDNNSYLPSEVLLQMRPPQIEKFLKDWNEQQMNAHESEVEEIKNNINNEYSTLKRQHNEFADYVHQQMTRSQSEQGDDAQSESRYSDFGSHKIQDPNFNYWGPPADRPPYDMPPHDMTRSGAMRNPQHRMPSGPPPAGGYPPDGNASNFPPMAWPGGPRGPPPNWGHSMPMHYPQSELPGHRNAFVDEGKERDRSDYDDSYEYTEEKTEKTDDYGNRYNNYYQYNGDRRDNNYDERPHSYRSGRPSRFSTAEPNYSEKDEDTPRRRPFPPPSTLPTGPDNVSDMPTEPLDLDPKCQPWQLPAALMHSLIRLRDFDYVPLDGQKIRLLPPTVPTDRLLTAIDNFYLPPSHDRTRDGEGWERLGLYEFYTKKERARDATQKLQDAKSGRDHQSNKSKRRRQYSGGSAASSHSEDDSIKDKGTNKQDEDTEYDRPFTRDDSVHGVRYGPPNLSYITSYPKMAVAQPIRTGLEALTCVPPPIQCIQGQLTHNYPGYKAVGPQPVLGSGGINIPPPRPPVMPGVGASSGMPGFPGPGFLQFPPPIPPGGLNQPPPPIPISQGMLHRPPMSVTSGFSSDRSRFDSRRSRSGSRSNSRSKSRSPSGGSRSRSREFHSRSQSRSRSRSRSTRSRSRSRSRSRDSRSRSRSPRGNSEKEFDNDRSRGYSERRRRNRSGSRSCSGSPFARFTSAAGPGGFTPGSSGGGGSNSGGPNSSARSAAMAAAASIANSINQSHNSAVWNNPGMGPGGAMGPYGGCQMGPNAPYADGPYGNNFSGPPNRGMGGGRGGFGGCVPPGRGPNMRFPGMGPDDRFHQPPRDGSRR